MSTEEVVDASSAESLSGKVRKLLSGIRGVDDLARSPLDEFCLLLAAGLREALPARPAAL